VFYLKISKLKPGDLFLYGVGALLGYHGLTFLARKFIDVTLKNVSRLILTEPYDQNLLEVLSVSKKVGPQAIAENNLRTTEGKLLYRPMGTPKKFPVMDNLMFAVSQLHKMPTEMGTEIVTNVVIGKKSKKPLTIAMPILITAMAYGEALSEAAKIALAKGASMAGTAINSGEGPFLPSERKVANKLILLYNRGYWNKSPKILKQADMIEIQLGQGAMGGVGHIIPAEKLDLKLKIIFKKFPGQDLIINSRQPEVQKPQDLRVLVDKLKSITAGVPIGVKIAAGKYLEKDLEWILDAEVDFIAIEGYEAATKGSAPILQDDFGIPIIYAIDRASNFLIKNNVKESVSLIAGGNLRTPGDFLKMIALGSDACYIGSAALFAIGHEQISKPLPFEPPTQTVWYDGVFRKSFDKELGANNLYKYLKSCNEEIIQGVMALGKTSIHEVNKDDLVALDESLARTLKIPGAYEAVY
jgi:glutamate synthase domain-containing protein 2